jgi:hypothetical protein
LSSKRTLALKEVENDLLSANKTGQAAYMQFVRERLLERIVNFNDFMKKLKLKTFTKIAQTVKVASKSKRPNTSQQNGMSFPS